ncbi:hypothetical protein DYB32_002134 [Aphanomyces invadans]|uniref:Condensin complex subunit 2 n=1 Tax=Aphanomyces invadans TaxID=157072 RepID=A0A3R6WQY5_9STRA|nr:hypothetical protein DYB32_002134 [Aphanomyces invadans]
MNNEYFDKKISVPRLDVTASSHNRRLTMLSQGLITPRKTPRKELEAASTSGKQERSMEVGVATQVDDHAMDEPDFGMSGDDEMGDYETGTPHNTRVCTVGSDEPEDQPVIAKPLNFDDEEDQTAYLLESALMRSVNAEQMDDYSFFDAKTLKNWAGPQHWKVKLPGIRIKKSAVRNPDGPAKPPAENDDEPIKGKKQSKQRHPTPGKLNFSLAPAQVAQALKKPKQKSSLEISAPILKRNESKAAELVHPVDMHIKVERFYQLFTRPRSNVMFASMMAPNKSNTHTTYHQPTSTFSHARHDDDNGVDFGDGGNDYLNDEDDFQVSGLIQADRIVDKVDIQYERFAKRVDVKKLKESIWDSLPFHNADDDASIQELTTGTANLELNKKAADDVVSFEELVHEVAPKVPSNVTVSFYFICMLHLANDKGLELVGQDDMRDFKILHDPSIAR